jgi:hypothetical protein
VPAKGDLSPEGSPLATVHVSIRASAPQARRVFVRGVRGDAQVAIGAAVVQPPASGRLLLDVQLTTSLPDSDGDGLPDVIDEDCLDGRCGGDASVPRRPDANGGGTGSGGTGSGGTGSGGTGSGGTGSGGNGGTGGAPGAGGMGGASGMGGAGRGGSAGDALDQSPGDRPAADAPPPATASRDGAAGADRGVGPADTRPPVDAPMAPVDAPAPIELRRGLVAHWRFDEAPGTGTAADSSGNGNVATLKGLDLQAAWIPGKIRGALQLDGAGFLLTNPTVSTDAVRGTLTVACWVWKSANQSGYRPILHRQHGLGLEDMFWFGFSGDAPYVSVDGLKAQRNAGAMADRWFHMAATYDGARLRIYVDGAMAGEATESGRALDPEPHGFTIGAELNFNNVDTAEAHLRGRLDELVLYDRALDAAELRALSAGQTP